MSPIEDTVPNMDIGCQRFLSSFGDSIVTAASFCYTKVMEKLRGHSKASSSPPGNDQAPPPTRENDPILEAFLTRLDPLLEGRKISRSGLAERIGISRNAISQFFRRERRPSTDILMRIADELGVSIDYLLGRSHRVDVEAGGRLADLVEGCSELTTSEQAAVLGVVRAILNGKHDRSDDR